MQLRLHNTLTRTKEDFTPSDPKNVRLYVCGPTVYQRIHVGNARPLVVFDVLFRLLRHLYGEDHVTYVRNITDIDDKIIAQAAANGEPIGELTARTTREFHEDAAALGCLPPTHEPRATDFITGMVALAETLIAKGHAYAADGHVLFHVPSMPTYGRLSGRDRADQIAGARVEVAPYKRDPADFVLWKPSTPDQPGWDSPWGRGRPGWHLECSAMSEALLGPLPFDIHGGGLDLIFPHHENEIAQSCCARDVERMARIWLHNGFVDIRGEKMAKSVGNVVHVDEVLARFPGEALRLWLLGTRYRQPISFSYDALQEAKRTLDRWYNLLLDLNIHTNDVAGSGEDVVSDLSDDLNLPRALASLHAVYEFARRETDAEKKRYLAFAFKRDAQLIGLLYADPEEWRKGSKLFDDAGIARHVSKAASSVAYSEDYIKLLLRDRAAARAARNFVVADAIRSELAAQGIIVEDRPDGTSDWRRA